MPIMWVLAISENKSCEKVGMKNYNGKECSQLRKGLKYLIC